MSYTPATKLPSLMYAQWSQPDQPNPRIASPYAADITDFTFSAPLLDHTGAAPTLGCLIGVRDSVTSYVEHIYAPPGAFSSDGLTATGLVRGIRLEGMDFTTSDPDKAIDLGPDSAVFLEVDPVLFGLMIQAMQGGIASGGNLWRIGNLANVDIKVTAANGDINEPFFMYDAATNQWVFSNNGVSSTPFGTGAGITGGSGIDVTAGVVSIDTGDTGIFVTSSAGAGDSGKVPVLGIDGKLSSTFFSLPTNNNFFGDGSDGDVTIPAGTTNLTRDMFYDHLIINGNLNPKNFRIFCKTSFVGNNGGKILASGANGNNGQDGSNSPQGAGGAAGTDVVGSLGTSFGGAAGGHGQLADSSGLTPGTAGQNVQSSLTNKFGGNGGTGGSGAAGAGSAGGASGNVTSLALSSPRNIVNGISFSDSGGNRPYGGGSGAGGGGGGAEGNSFGGGGGGAGGNNSGNVLIASPTITFNTGFEIHLDGGNGGNGGNATGGNSGGGAPGGGGCGGVGAFIYNTITNNATITAAAGVKGTAGTGFGTGTSGSGGANGDVGTTYFFQLN